MKARRSLLAVVFAPAVVFGAVACGTGAGTEGAGALDAMIEPATSKRAGDKSAGSSKAAAAPDPGPVLFDLLANRLLAHVVYQGGPLLDGSTPAMLKHVRGGWGTGWEAAEPVGGGELATILTTRSGNVSFPMTDAAAVEARELVLRVLPPKAGTRLSVFLNEKPLGDTELPAAGLQTVRIKIPAGVAVGGENVLRIFSGGKGTIGGRAAYLALSRAWLGREGVAEPPASGGWFDPGAEKLRLPAVADGLAWYVQVPPRARLWLELDAAGGCAVSVTAHEDAVPVVLVGSLKTTGAPQTLDLGALGGHTVRLELALVGEGCSNVGARGAALVGPATPTAPPVAAPEAPVDHVVLWIVDAFRADLLDAYGGMEVDTPHMDALARSGTVFLNAAIQGSESKVGAATLFTGTYPTVAKMVRDSDRLPARLPVMPELFRGAGWKTASFISNGYISSAWGFDRGWDKHINFVRESRPSNAGKVWGNAKEWLVAEKPKHAFLYMQPADTHVPYRAHAGILERYDPEPYDGPFKKVITGFDLADFITKKVTWTDRDKARVRALYNNAATYNDRVFGEMLAELPALLPGRILLVISADHGEEFFDHGSVGHGSSLYDELVHVPLVLSDNVAAAAGGPGAAPVAGSHFPPGTVVRDDVETLDVLPTVLTAAAVPLPATVQGRDLAPLARAATAIRYVRPAFSFQLEWWRAMRAGAWKFHLKGKNALLFDRENDPGEKTDIAAARPVAVRHCLDAMSFFLAWSEQWKKGTDGDPANHGPGLATREKG